MYALQRDSQDVFLLSIVWFTQLFFLESDRRFMKGRPDYINRNSTNFHCNGNTLRLDVCGKSALYKSRFVTNYVIKLESNGS